jgi:signal transduction histidine kinase
VPDDLPLAAARGRLNMLPCAGAESAASAVPAAEPTELTEPALPAAGLAAPATTPHASKPSTTSWELLYGVVFLAVLVLVAFSGSFDVRTAIAVTSIAAMAPWYLLVGRSHLRAADGTVTRRAVIYIAGIVVLFTVAVLQNPNAWFLCIALLPQCSEALPDRRALIPALIMTAAGAVSLGYWSQSSAGIATAVVLFVAITAFNFGVNFDLGRIITQSRERAELIEQLETTRAELAEVSRQAGVMAERQRLAGEIHDTLAQGFSSILMLIQAAEAQLELSPATARRQLSLAAQTARENLAEARTLVGGLASAQLQAGTLEDALRRITERTSDELGLQASFATDGTGRELPAATEVVLLRTGQEALANVRKHAAARSVAVRLCYASDRVRLEVTDDGAGFDPAVVNGGYGLRGMRARVDEAGGTIVVRSAPAEGTSVQVEVPA